MSPTKSLSNVWHNTFVQTTVSFVSAIAMSIAVKDRITAVSLSFLLIAAWNLVSFFVLFFYRKVKSEKIAITLYILNVLVSGLAIMYNQNHWVQTQGSSDIFFGFKFVAVFIAFQCPTPVWLGLASLAFVFLIPFIQFYSWSAAVQERFAPQEPWFTLVLILSCILIYYQRVKLLSVIRKNTELETSTKELRHFAEILLGVQHLVNTPLQIIESTADLMALKHPQTEALSQKIKSAAAPIKKICSILSLSKARLNWDQVRLTNDVDELQLEIKKLVNSPGLNPPS